MTNAGMSFGWDPGKGRGVGCEGRGDLGVRFDKLNELRGEAGQDLELVERPGAGDSVGEW